MLFDHLRSLQFWYQTTTNRRHKGLLSQKEKYLKTNKVNTWLHQINQSSNVLKVKRQHQKPIILLSWCAHLVIIQSSSQLVWVIEPQQQQQQQQDLVAERSALQEFQQIISNTPSFINISKIKDDIWIPGLINTVFRPAREDIAYRRFFWFIGGGVLLQKAARDWNDVRYTNNIWESVNSFIRWPWCCLWFKFL